MRSSPASSESKHLNRRAAWWAALAPAKLVPNLTTGLLLGALMVTISVSMATLMYGAALPEHLDRAIGLALVSSLALGLLVTLLGSQPGVVAHVQDAPAAVLASAASGLVAGTLATGAGDAAAAGTAADTLPAFMTFAATVAATALTSGATLLLVGLFRLGRLVRYLPYPVTGGFMAGTGWLLVTGGLSVMTGLDMRSGSPLVLLGPETLGTWLPGAAMAALLLLVSRNVRHYLAWPMVVLAAAALFYLVVLARGGDLAQLRSAGYLLGPFPDADLLQGLRPADLGLVDWSQVLAQLPTVITVAGLTLLAVLLNSTAIELTTDRRVDLDRELRAAGLGNLVAGGLGGQVGYQSVSLTALNARAGTGGRGGLVVGLLVVAGTLLFGARALDYVPTLLVGGLIAFLGLDFLYEWLWAAYRRLTFLEYAVVVVILVVIAAAGFLPGVAVGLVLTVALFVVNYSRIDAVRHALTGAELRSRVRRDPGEQRAVAAGGTEVLVLQLQGYLFFGTMNGVLERVRRRLEEGPISSVILDFRRVTGVDATATVALRRLLLGATGGPGGGGTSGYRLILTELPVGVLADLRRRGLATELSERATLHPSLDEALEASEALVLGRSQRGPTATDTSPSCAQTLRAALGTDVDAALLEPYLTQSSLGSGERLIAQGEAPDALYFVASGRLSTWLATPSGDPTRLESMRGGSVVGEIGFFTGESRTASVVADEPTTVYRLSRPAMSRLREDVPVEAAALVESLARLMAERIRHLMATVEALER